jgi:hypothetical protein
MKLRRRYKTIVVDAENFVGHKQGNPWFVGLFVKNVCIYSEVIKML